MDEHDLVREGFKAILLRYVNLEVIADTGDGYEALKLCRTLHPDLIMMELSLSSLSGLDVISLVRRRFPKIRILVLSGRLYEDGAAAATDAGAEGYILKQSGIDTLKSALSTVLSGRCYIDPQLNSDEILALRRQGKFERRCEVRNRLTLRERQILKLIAEGERNKEIAEKLAISRKTVESHRANMMQKLEAHSAVELAQWARRLGLVSS
ncbi:LuxR C-terminal-related transcriptional regulator [Burkholderia sp. Bp8986]|uniref:LuxR C-terminal-related transcriptional regulator n=1 Tax=Burkholderia sp. Bp8986 TaxID=2184550 RepID=UPI0016395067|nr:LuxR C-terminal-related transcriptional regulator [Burkholderia sp. Bp8986]